MDTLLNVIGLTLNIIGVVLLWNYGLPPAVSRGGIQYLAARPVDEAEKRKAEWYDNRSKLAMWLIILGFVFQLAAALWTW